MRFYDVMKNMAVDLDVNYDFVMKNISFIANQLDAYKVLVHKSEISHLHLIMLLL